MVVHALLRILLNQIHEDIGADLGDSYAWREPVVTHRDLLKQLVFAKCFEGELTGDHLEQHYA